MTQEIFNEICARAQITSEAPREYLRTNWPQWAEECPHVWICEDYEENN